MSTSVSKYTSVEGNLHFHFPKNLIKGKIWSNTIQGVLFLDTSRDRVVVEARRSKDIPGSSTTRMDEGTRTTSGPVLSDGIQVGFR